MTEENIWIILPLLLIVPVSGFLVFWFYRFCRYGFITFDYILQNHARQWSELFSWTSKSSSKVVVFPMLRFLLSDEYLGDSELLILKAKAKKALIMTWASMFALFIGITMTLFILANAASLMTE